MPLNNFTLLYIEDSHDTQDYMKHYLEDEVKEFYQAFDGEEGLKIYQDKKPDIILTDINMPRMNGLDMCAKIKKIDKHQNIILLSAFQDIETLKVAINIGVDGFILKPLGANNILLEKLNNIAENLQNKIDVDNLKSRIELALLGNNDGLWDWNLVDNSLYLSPRGKEILGYSDKELPNEFSTWDERLNPDDKESVKSLIQANIEGKTDYYETIHRLKHKSGSWVWVHARGKTIFDENEKAVRMIGTHTDISAEKEVQFSLQKSNALLKKLSDNIPAAIYQYRLYPDGSSSFPYASIGIKDVYEVTPENVISNAQLVFDVLHPDDVNMIVDSINISAKTMKPWILEYRVNLPKKGLRWLAGHAQPEKLEDGSILWHGFIDDITERKKIETKLNQVSERMELALLGNNDGIWDWNIVTNEVYFSPRWKEILGYSDDELPNEFPSWEDRVHPDDLHTTMDIIQNSLDGKTDYMENTHRMKHKDGSWVWILDRGKTIFDKNGKATRMLGTHTNITLEKAIQLKFSQQSQMIEQIHDSIISTDMEGIITNFNHGSEILLDYKADEMIGLHVASIYLEEDFEKLDKNIEDLKNHGESHSEVHLVKKSGKVIDADLSLSLLKDEKGNPIGMVGYSQDITIRKKIEEEILNINKNLSSKIKDEVEKNRKKDRLMLHQSRLAQMGEMISMIAHQWRQPLNILSILNQTIILKYKRGKLNTDIVDYFSENSDKQIRQMSETIDDFRDFFKPEKQKIDFYLNDVVLDILSMVKPIFSKDNIYIKFEKKEKYKVYGYPNELGQAILNIINNAKDALVENDIENRNIFISLNGNDSNVILTIKDNAGGVPTDLIDKIFDPYFSTKEDKNGTGLGLYMSKLIIEEHADGKLNLYNIENGASFEIILERKE